ncbi:MAG: iron-sulfur cluster assembly scaffold protein [archaeon]|nr:iron-sulfur cluster assembly scaffold protein [archaeon]
MKKKRNFDKFAEELQKQIDRKDQEDFSAYALDLGKNPYHYGSMTNPSIIHAWRGPCGDKLTFYLKIKNDIVENATFELEGCTTAAMAASQTIKMIENKTIDEIRKITDKEVLIALGKFPSESEHCATLSIKTLNYTLHKYKNQDKND